MFTPTGENVRAMQNVAVDNKTLHLNGQSAERVNEDRLFFPREL